jgi:phage portal protein BeeE
VAKLWRALLGREISRYSVNDYAADQFRYNGASYALGASSSAWSKSEEIENDFVAYIQSLYKQNGVVYAVMAARRLLFKQARPMWQEFADGMEGGLFWTPELEVFRRPWPNGTTGEMLSRMDQDASLGGNSYTAREEGRLRRLRPDWVSIILTAPPAEAVKSDVAGYWFHPGRRYTAVDRPEPVDEFYLPDELAHWTPDPDPDAQYRGMSWLAPVVREIMADKAATTHKAKFFENGATLGAIISAKENLTSTQFEEWKNNVLATHQGVEQAYRPLFLGSPVDVTLQGLDLRQLDFKVTQGHGETRVCAAGRVPPIIVGVSEGLEAATYSNYGQARRAFGDGWAHPQWEDAVGALETIVVAPDRPARLWYKHDHIAFLREDQKDAAEIQQTKQVTIRGYIEAGFTKESAIAAVDADDRSLLVDSGYVSVQLLRPGEGEPDSKPDAEPDEPDPEAERARNELKHYWLHGEGAGRWNTWTELRDHLLEHVGPGRAERIAAEWFHERHGYWPGADKNRVAHGKPPRGNVVGPG